MVHFYFTRVWSHRLSNPRVHLFGYLISGPPRSRILICTFIPFIFLTISWFLLLSINTSLRWLKSPPNRLAYFFQLYFIHKKFDFRINNGKTVKLNAEQNCSRCSIFETSSSRNSVETTNQISTELDSNDEIEILEPS